MAIGRLGNWAVLIWIASLDDIYSFTFIFYVLRFLWSAIGMYTRSSVLEVSFILRASERAFSLCVYVYLYSPHKRSEFTSSIYNLSVPCMHYQLDRISTKAGIGLIHRTLTGSWVVTRYLEREFKFSGSWVQSNPFVKSPGVLLDTITGVVDLYRDRPVG